MTGWKVASASASGCRRMCQSPRRVMTQTSLKTEGRRDSGVPMSTGEVIALIAALLPARRRGRPPAATRPPRPSG